MKNKTDRYLDRVFEKTPKVRVSLPQLAWSLMPFAALGLAIWSLYSTGGESALTSAHALAWVYIVLDTLMLGIVAIGGMFRAAIEDKHKVSSDKILFASRRSNFLGKFTAMTDTTMYIATAILAGWAVATVLLVLLMFAELAGKQINKNNRKERLAELEKTDEAELHALFATEDEEEAVGQEINEIFRK
jgi:steroid 5-alpha reductase family enzyme